MLADNLGTESIEKQRQMVHNEESAIAEGNAICDASTKF